MNNRVKTIYHTSIYSPEWVKIDDYNHRRLYAILGFRTLGDFLGMSVYDFLNMNQNDSGYAGNTIATRLCESGINIKVIQNVLGHVDISTTMNIYIDVTKDLKKEEMQNFANYVRSGNSKEPIINSI